MELYFMPSDVARVVLGYLKDSNYVKTYNSFLKECCHLKEIYNLERAGRSLKKVTQFNLVRILEEWGQYKYSVDNSVVSGNNFTGTPSSDETVDDTLVYDNDVTASGRKTKARARNNSKKSPQLLKARQSPCMPKSLKVRLKSPRSTQSVPIVKSCKENISENDTAGYSNTENINEFTPKKSMVSSQNANSADKPCLPTRVCTDDAVAETEIDRSAHNRLHDAADIKSLKRTENGNDSPKADFHSNRQVDTEQLEVNIYLKEKEENILQGKIHESGKLEKERAEHTNQYKYINAIETSKQVKQLVEDKKIEDGSSTHLKKKSEPSITTVPEPPSDSVGSCKAKCLAWINRNECGLDESSESRKNITNREDTDDSEKTDLKENDNLHRKNENVQEHLCAHTDESSNEVTTSKSSGSEETHKSNTQEVEASTSDTLLQKQGTVVPQHVTPKKMSPPGSRDRSLITPVKLVRSSEHHINRSPRRKKPKTPRKRASEVSPVSVVSTKSVDPGSVNPIFEKILADHRLHEKLAETCNLVHSQIKLANSGKENKSDTRLGEQISPLPIHHSYDQETVTASRSLEEILGIDHNFHSELLSDNIDMSDPAYESLFKLFGTDRETFNEYLRKEKEKELALMEAEVEELERSNHEILCANFGVSQADAGYETEEVAYGSPHRMPLSSQQDLFSSQHASPSHATSTPCAGGVPVNLTPLLRGSELEHSAQSVFGGLKKTGVDAKISPSSTATQPFSPAFSHYSEMNNPPTPHNQKHLSTYVNENSPAGPATPSGHIEDPYSNPATPVQSNPCQIMHSTPTGPGSVRSTGNPDHFHHSSPIHSQHSAVKSNHNPIRCSPLVKADINPRSPLISQTNVYQDSCESGLYFNSHVASGMANINGHNFAVSGCIAETDNFSEPSAGYLNLLNEAASIAASREPCSTIENTIGCISLPEPPGKESKANNKKKSTSRSRRKKVPVKRKSVSASHVTVKGLLEKPLTHLNSIPLTMKVADLQHVYRTPEKRIPMPAENLTFPSPGGKTLINVPLLNCEDQIDLSVLGMDENIDGAGSHSVHVYDQNLDTSTQYTIAPENQATHDLVNAIEAGKTTTVIQQIQQRKSNEAKQKISKRSNTERKSRTKKKKESIDKDEQHDHFSPTPPSSDQPILQHEGCLDPDQEVYTATPFTSLNKAATVRALNFGPNIDDPNIAHYRKIYPKLQTPSDTSPSVLILNTNQVINPGQRVIVNRTPVTLVQKMPNSSEVQNDTKINDKREENLKTESTCVNVGADNAESEKLEKVGSSVILRHSKDIDKDIEKEVTGENVNNCDTCIEADSNETITEKTPIKEIQSPTQMKNSSNETPKVVKQSHKQTRNLSKELTEELGAYCSDGKSYDCKSNQESSQNIDKNSKDKNVTKQAVSKHSYKKKDDSSKSYKTRGGKGKEKLKVKIPMMCHRSPNGKGRDNKSEKSVIPFYFKRKTEIKLEVTSSDEDVPLSVLRKQCNKVKKKECKSVEIIVESESTDEENATNSVQSTPSKTKECLIGDHTTSKEVLFEKIGLTPTKSLAKHDLKSPNRANALDVLAEWQSSPLSSRCRGLTPVTRNRFSRVDDGLKSPTKLKRTHAKQLFSDKEKCEMEKVNGCKAKQTAKRVEDIIDRLKLNNPDRNLGSANTKRNKKKNINDKNGDFTEVDHETRKSKHNKGKTKISKGKKTDPDGQNEKLNTRCLRSENGDRSASSITEKDMSLMHHETHLIDGKADKSSEIINDQSITANRNALALNENSHDACELNMAIASIATDHADTNDEEKQTLSVNQSNKKELYHYESEDLLRESYNTENVCEEVSQTNHSRSKVSSGKDKSPENQDCSQAVIDPSDFKSQHTIIVDVHATQNSQDSCEMIEKFKDIRKTESVQQIKQLDKHFKEGYKDHPAEASIGFKDKAEEDTVNSEQLESMVKEKRRKHKRKHRHRRRGEGSSEVNNVGDQFVSPGEGEREHRRHDHKKKKKKSKKRHREESEDLHESKRRRKEKTKNVSLDSLAALNVDEALSQIYGKQPPT